MIVTNNDKVYEKFKDDYSIYYKDCSFREVLLYVRDRTYDKFKKDKNFTIELTDKIIYDFKLIDLSIIEHAIL